MSNLIDKLREKKIGLQNDVAKVKYRVFKDSSGARTIATVPKYKSKTKSINNKYFAFHRTCGTRENLNTINKFEV